MSRVGYAQVVVSHEELVAHIDVGRLLCLLFERIERSLDIDRVSVGVCPGMAGTWFRFAGPLHEEGL
jgi:hypothetical protein